MAKRGGDRGHKTERNQGPPRPGFVHAVVGHKLERGWEGTLDGKPLTGLNEVFMPASDGADSTQRVTVNVAGERVMDMSMEHHRMP